MIYSKPLQPISDPKLALSRKPSSKRPNIGMGLLGSNRPNPHGSNSSEDYLKIDYEIITHEFIVKEC